MAIPWGWVNRPLAPETEPNDLKCKIYPSPLTMEDMTLMTEPSSSSMKLLPRFVTVAILSVGGGDKKVLRFGEWR